MTSVSRGRLVLSPGTWRIVKKCESYPAPGVPQVYRSGTYCRTAVLPLWIGRYVLLHCYCTAVVVGWSVGGSWVVGAWCVAARSRSTRWRGVVNNEPLRVSYRAAGSQDSGTNQILLAYRLHCCTVVVAWSVGGGGARGWVERVV